MHRVLAIILAVAMGSAAAPAFAQTNQSPPQNTSTDPGPQDPSGLDAYAQVPPPVDFTQLLMAGLVIGGVVTILVVANQNNNSSPASP